MFPISFNAFGDIVTAAQILYSMAKSLSETHGAPQEYRRFVDYLYEMGALMMQIHSIVSESPNAGLRKTILSKIAECCLQVEKGLDRVAKLEPLAKVPEPGSVSPGKAIRRGLHKVEWHFRYRGDVARVQEEMQTVLQSLQVSVTSANYMKATDIGQQASAIHEETRATRVMLDLMVNGSLRAQHQVVTLNANLSSTRVNVETMGQNIVQMVNRASAIQEDVRAARRDSVEISADVHKLDFAVMEAMGIVSAVYEDTQTLLANSATVGVETSRTRADIQNLDRKTTEMLHTLSAVQEGLVAVQSRLSGADNPLPVERVCPWYPPPVPHIEVTPSSPSPHAVVESSPKGAHPPIGGLFPGSVSPAPSYAFDLESDQWVTDNGLQLHWQLLPYNDLGLDRPRLYFDIRYDLSEAYHVRDGRGSPIPDMYLERFATRRPIPRMTFTIDGLSGCYIVINRPQGVRVRDVLHRVQEVLQIPLTLSEKRDDYLGRVKRGWSHYEERVGQERLRDAAFVDAGMRRLDLLESRFVFDGCQWRPPREGYPHGSWTLMFTHPVWRYEEQTG
ncbi:unnamed protein product [Peniophora sp. CBMAI 1063]|nr:unnamed protein product [Peniophora sp. CBMAI 1063]